MAEFQLELTLKEKKNLLGKHGSVHELMLNQEVSVFLSIYSIFPYIGFVCWKAVYLVTSRPPGLHFTSLVIPGKQHLFSNKSPRNYCCWS